MSCLTVVFGRVGGMSATLVREGGRLSCASSRALPGPFGFGRSGDRVSGTASLAGQARCAFGLVCGVSISTPEGYKVLWGSDGQLITIEGGMIYVKITG